MEQNELFEGEEIITESGDKVVTLTNKRVRYHASSAGQAHIVSIMLDKISSIEVHYSSQWIVLFLSIALMLAGVVTGLSNERQGQLGMGLAVFGVVLLLIYLFTRKHIVSIASDGGAKINFETKGMKRESVLDFINKVEKAKNKF